MVTTHENTLVYNLTSLITVITTSRSCNQVSFQLNKLKKAKSESINKNVYYEVYVDTFYTVALCRRMKKIKVKLHQEAKGRKF